MQFILSAIAIVTSLYIFKKRELAIYKKKSKKQQAQIIRNY